jgi:cell division protein FtsW (lipid II flippase)
MNTLSLHNLGRRFLGVLRRLPLLTGPITAAAGLLIVLFWWHNVSHLLRDTAPVVSLSQTEVRLRPGQTVTIGRDELLQGQGSSAGETEHVAFTHETGGRLVLRNVARGKRLWLNYANGAGVYSARWQLQTGDVAATQGAVLRVAAREGNRLGLQLQRGSETVQIEIQTSATGSSVLINGAPPPVCTASSWLDGMRSTLRGFLARDDRGEDRILELGGALTCQVRDEVLLAAPALPFRSFNIVTRAGEFFIAPGEVVAGVRQPIQFRRGNLTVSDFSDIAWELDPAGPEVLNSVIIGRTSYRVATRADGQDRIIALTPAAKLQRLTQVQAKEALDELDDPAVKVTATAARQPFSRDEMPNILAEINGGERAVRLALGGLLLGLAFMGALWRLREARGWGHLGALMLSVAAFGLATGAVALAFAPDLARMLGQSLSFEQSIKATILAYALASALILLSSAFGVSTKVFWIATLGLISLGNLTLLSLAIDSPRTDFSVHVHKNKLLFVDIVPVMALVIATLPASLVAAWPRSFFAGGRWIDSLGRFVPSLLMLLGLLAWAIIGTETGVAGFQPVELGKAALVLLLAHVFAGFLRINMFYAQRQYLSWLVATILTALVFFLFLTAVPFLKSDYSPILIILITTVVLIFAFLAPGVIQRIGATLDILRRRKSAPQRRFKLGMPRGAALAGVLLLLLGLNVGLLAAFPRLASKIIAGEWTIPKERMAAIELLEKARSGPLRVPAERLLTWYDLDQSVFAPRDSDARSANVLHRDLGLQLLYSKVALSHTPCALARLDLGRLDLGLENAGYFGAQARVLMGGTPQTLACRFVTGWPTEDIATVQPASETPAATFTVADLLRVPVIQNDFIATYLMVRFGLPAGLAVVSFEFFFVVGLIFLAAGLRLRPGVGFQDEAARTGMSIVTAGIATLFALHWLISWGNAIGVLPVMGQPMTLIAAATSHHLLMALPCIGLGLVAGRLHGYRQKPVNRAPPDW